jgi:hypothetical protein
VLGGIDCVGLAADTDGKRVKDVVEALEVARFNQSCGPEHLADVGTRIAGVRESAEYLIVKAFVWAELNSRGHIESSSRCGCVDFCGWIFMGSGTV